MLHLREARAEELDTCIHIVQEAFADYFFFKVFVDDPTKKEQFYRQLMTTWVCTTAAINTLYVGEENGTIQAVAGVQAPGERDIEVKDYARYGGLEALAIAGEEDTHRFLEMLAISDEPCRSLPDPKWFFELLAVRTDRVGQGIGSRMLNDALVPLVAAHGGGLVTLNTNTEPNVRFYQKNGFEVIDERMLHANGHDIPNWSFTRQVSANAV